MRTTNAAEINIMFYLQECLFVELLVRIDALRPSQQQWSCRDVASILLDFYPTLFRMALNATTILKESIRKRIFGPVHIHLDVTVRVTNQIPPIYPIIIHNHDV